MRRWSRERLLHPALITSHDKEVCEGPVPISAQMRGCLGRAVVPLSDNGPLLVSLLSYHMLLSGTAGFGFFFFLFGRAHIGQYLYTSSVHCEIIIFSIALDLCHFGDQD